MVLLNNIHDEIHPESLEQNCHFRFFPFPPRLLPLPGRRPVPLPRPNQAASFFFAFDFEGSSTSHVSNGKLSGRIKYHLMLFFRILSDSKGTGTLFFRVILTVFKQELILISDAAIVS